MNFQEEFDERATPTEACREYARNYGSMHPERAWVLTDFDTWERNPYYHGPPVQHPEDDRMDEAYASQLPDFVANGHKMTDQELAAYSRLNE